MLTVIVLILSVLGITAVFVGLVAGINKDYGSSSAWFALSTAAYAALSLIMRFQP